MEGRELAVQDVDRGVDSSKLVGVDLKRREVT